MKLKIHKPIESWQVFHACKEKLGKEYLLQLWGFRNATSIYQWCADPRVCEDSRPNPIDKLSRMFEDLCALGYRDLALAGIKCLARPLGFEVKDPKETMSDKEDLTLEFIDASSALGKLGKTIQEALQDGEITTEEVALIQEAVDSVINELLQIKDVVKKAKKEE